jgi:hypothetical protein
VYNSLTQLPFLKFFHLLKLKLKTLQHDVSQAGCASDTSRFFSVLKILDAAQSPKKGTCITEI